jgi:tetratricopeptide (TPR) repeat protein
MDELELAKRAVRRGLLTEEQLREARAFAEGGRSLVAVLLDLGYLKPQHVLELGDVPAPPPAPPARSGTAGWLLVAAAVGILGMVIGRSCAPARTVYQSRWVPAPAPEPPPPAAPELPLGGRLLIRANEVLAVAEERAAREPALSAETEGALHHAAALLEEALLPPALLPRESRRHALFSLGRAQELAGRWEGASKSYAQALKENPGFTEARLGAARTKLLLQDPASAFAMADQACGEASPPAEAFLVRAKARLAMGDGVRARQDLLSARTRNPALAAEVNRLLTRLDESR